jgi:hypothetical protein
MTGRETEDVLDALRGAYALAGSPNGPACHTRTCLQVARVRVFWPVAPGQDYPLYCPPCAARARGILETLNIRYANEALPPRADSRRALDLRADLREAAR